MAPEKPNNPGIPLDLGLVLEKRINRSAVERRVATIAKRRSVKKEWQAAWLLKAITLIDLTTLSGDDTPGRVRRLAAKARQPVRQDILEALGMADKEFTVGAVCVYPNRVRDAVAALHGSGIPVAAVSTGFPSGQVPLEPQLVDVEKMVEWGAREIDMVISRDYVHTGNWQGLYDEVKAFRAACGNAAHLKTIIETGELGTLTNVYRASMICMQAGADFIKTSTGKAKVNATLAFGLVMMRAIRDYYELTGYKVGFKPAGGISTAKQALDWLILLKEELGDEWMTPELFRFGASSLLADIERQLWHHVSGRYAAAHYMPMT
jgi:deoxyribose-phosphate aldolase